VVVTFPVGLEVTFNLEYTGFHADAHVTLPARPSRAVDLFSILKLVEIKANMTAFTSGRAVRHECFRVVG